MIDATSAAGRLLHPDDPPAFRAMTGTADTHILVVCDHAARAVPRALADLGLPPSELRRHIGWDIGAARVAESLAGHLGADAVLAGYSRLVIDCNRALDDFSLISETSDGTVIPANRAVTDADRARRVDECFWPYHRAVTARLDALAIRGRLPVLLSVHSFTPAMDGFARPWQIGILWDRDDRIPAPLMRRLAAVSGLCVGDNEPYTGRDQHGFTIPHHAEPRGLPHVLIELRQDEISQETGVARYASLLAEALAPILADDTTYL